MQYVQASHNHLIMTAAYVSENKRQLMMITFRVRCLNERA